MTEIKLNTYARVAGLAYIIVILLGVFSVNFIVSALIVPDNIIATHIVIFPRMNFYSELVLHVKL